MKPELQQISIAEACEWKGPFKHYDSWERTPGGLYGDSPNFPDQPVPDYLGDLNAMREALQTLPDEAWCDYWDALCDVTGADKANDWGKHYTDPKTLLCATPAQQAESFLRVKGLWVDTPPSIANDDLIAFHRPNANKLTIS